MKEKFMGLLKKYLESVFIVIFCIAGLFSLGYYYKIFGQNEISNDPGRWGTFGDYIGGVLGTLTSLIALYYIFKTYRKQTKNNRIDLLMKIHESIVNDIASIKWMKPNKETVFGEEAIMEYRMNHENNVVTDKLNYIINSYDFVIKLCKSYKDDEDYQQLLERFYLSFYTKIIWPCLHGEAYENFYKMTIERTHDDSKYIFDTFAIIDEDAFRFLATKSKIEINNDYKTSSLEKIRNLKIAKKNNTDYYKLQLSRILAQNIREFI